MHGSSACRVAAIALAILLVATVCVTSGFVLGGGIGLVTGGAAGYAIGRAQSARVGPRIEIPIPQRPGEEEERPPEGLPGAEMAPYLGVHYRTVEEGARIMIVIPGSPAERAGLRGQDVILAVDGKPVGAGHPDLAARILEYEPWSTVGLRVRRDGKELKLEVTLGAQIRPEGHFRLLPEGELFSPTGPHPPRGWLPPG